MERSGLGEHRPGKQIIVFFCPIYTRDHGRAWQTRREPKLKDRAVGPCLVDSTDRAGNCGGRRCWPQHEVRTLLSRLVWCVYMVRRFPAWYVALPGGLGPPAEEHRKLIASLLCDAMMIIYSHRRKSRYHGIIPARNGYEHCSYTRYTITYVRMACCSCRQVVAQQRFSCERMYTLGYSRDTAGRTCASI